MENKIQLRIIKVLPTVTGTSKAGNQWSKQEYVGETFDQYPKNICFGVFNPKDDMYKPIINDVVEISFDVESRQWVTKDLVERWSTEVRAYRIERVADPNAVARLQAYGQQPIQQQSYAPQQAQAAQPYAQAPQYAQPAQPSQQPYTQSMQPYDEMPF